MDAILIIFLIIIFVYLINALYVARYLIPVFLEKDSPFLTENLPDEPQQHAGFLFIVTTECVDDRIQITWEFKQGIRNLGFSLVGFRKQTGYEDYQEGHIRSYDNGQLFDSTEEGCTYIYKFQMERELYMLPPFSGLLGSPVVDEITFSIKVASTQERINALKQFKELKELEDIVADMTKRKVKKDAIKDRMDQIVKGLKGHLQTDQKVSLLEKQLIDEITSGPYSEREKRDMINRLRLKILDIKNRL
jgi:hypothetical protein